MNQSTYRTWMETELHTIANNFHAIARRLPDGCRIMPVVKADAYGVDAVPVARVLEAEGCDFFAVTFIEEALRLRDSGIKADILVMAPIDDDCVARAAAHNLIVTLSDVKSAKDLAQAAARANVHLRAHIKLDTGLCRLGIVTMNREEEAVLEVETIMALPEISSEGIYTHITSSDLPGGNELNLRELERYRYVTDTLLQKGKVFLRHCLSTGPMIGYPAYTFDYVRIGSIIYGAYGSSLGAYGDYSVENAIHMKTTVMQVKSIPAGSSISYGPLFTTLRDTRIAIVPVGFADGMRRALSNKGHMIVRGRLAPIIGKICCDHTILDVTDIPDVAKGDIVTIFGKDGSCEQTPGHYARLIGATAAEITSVFNERIPRIPV